LIIFGEENADPIARINYNGTVSGLFQI
jgi:hypothetical protein